ncbi:hypothetical protein LAZ67_23001090 [Cordylochernes scorpioides]|uniref:Integrase catalytic domain-containing protein n=1 Tax=Cordylochernes scorpioides TaxID=51811 RepID=A0ABY6LQE8_9ARAC|nr:hypothetical protein LAZ67_23001090 [Cordylochernes scorpioides]
MWDPIARKIIINRDVIFTEANTSENIQDNQQEQVTIYSEESVDSTNTISKSEESCRYPLRNGHCYVHDQEPLNYEDAIVGQNSKKWKLAIDDEFNSLMKKQIWTYVTLPSDRKAIACKWVYKIKQNADGSNKMFKARLVAKGYSQKSGLDYGETFYPVVKFDSIRTILSLCASLDMEMIQLDVKSAFLNGDLEEELYMEQSQGYENPDFPNHLQSVPSDPYSKLTKEICPKDNQEIEEMNKIPYRQTIGSLMYLMTGTRPDIAYAVSRKIFGYLKATKNIGICFGGSSCTTSLIGFSDADFAGDLNTRKSTTGYMFMLNNEPISWCSQKQNRVSLSTTESEYIAASKATKEAIWLRQLLRELHQEQVKPTTIFCDNQSCIRLVHNPEYHKITKHIDISYHFVRDHFQKHAIDLLYVCSNDQAADIFTKALPPERYRRLRSQLGMTPVRARFTKAFNELETEIKKKEVKKADVEKILRRLQTHHEKLSILNMRMEEYEDNFSNIMTDYEALAEKDDVSTISGTAAMNYRLPKLEFKKFGGEPREWITFWSQFSTIDRDPQMPPETKFQYLFQATAENSEAREAVESFPPSADNYPKVIEYIKSRFGEDEMLVEIYVRDLLQNVLQNTRAEGKMSVVKLYDRLETQLRALETLGVARDKFAAMLYPLVESALPEDTLRVWERSQNTVSGRGVQDKLTQLMTFLKTEVKGESRVNMAKAAFKIDNNQDAKYDRSNRKSLSKKNTGSKMPTATDLANTTQMRNNCIFCGNGHPSQECYSGQRMHLPEKKDKAKGKNACFWCLLPGHGFKKCRIKPRCPVCGGKHYPIMCPTLEAQKTSHLQKAELKVSRESPATKQETANQFTSTTLNNATVGGVYLQTLIVKISGPKGKHNVRVLLDCGEIRQKKHNVYKVNVSSLNNEYMDDLKFLDQEVICGNISQVQDHTILNELKARGINLTDICQGEEISIHMLIGSDLLSSILTGRMQILQNGVVATETKLGWTVMGPAIGKDMEDSCLIVTSFHVNSFDVQDLWKLDVLGIMDAAETISRKDLIEASNTHFKETVKRDESGRYIVSLPWIAGHPPVPVNRRTTENRLLTTTRNVQGKMLYEKYDTIFEEWEKERFIEEVDDKWEECSYLPHRPVLKDSHNTPIRPVFDASCKKKELPSLNQCLEKGDNLIELIPDLLLRFRLGKYGIIADMRKAFPQIQVREEDREFLRFLWWKKDQKALKFYRRCRVVFGLTSSPFLLAATIKYHLSLPQFQDNRCAELLARSFYVDNCILSLSSTHDVKEFIKESSDIMMQAKFELRDWMWNEPGITEQDPASILGMKWHLQTDTIAINVQSLKNIDEEKSITKRSILSACHRIFDPIQFTCPVTIKIKKMVQDAWKENKSWDEQLNEDRRVEFIKWRKQALELDQIKIPRWILPIKEKTTLHVFCDASAIAHATVIFMRIENASVIVVRFVEARNRLATIKRITIPRLELLACLIGARLLRHVLENLEESPEKIQCWTDSSPALYWIQQQENWAQLNHVAGEHNPADLPSRGESPSKFTKSGWWEGPKWLQEKKEDWPVSKLQYDLEAIEEERRKTVVAGFVAKKPEENPWYLNLYEGKREVTLTQILRVIAWILRFKPSEYKGDIISQEELDSAEKSLVKIIQSESIGEEDPKMKQLHAFQDKEGLWRVKTRIVNRNDDELFRLPILIPTNHPVTELIVKSVHEKMYHCGAQTLRSVLREKFWIPKARQLVRHVIHKCPRCRRFETKRDDVPEASLPQHRVRDVVVFEVTGIDLGGPSYLEDGQKVWFVIFTCGVYRAVHLELVTSLSTEALVGAVERFLARRGCPAVIYSDNGTNLVGLRNELYRVNFGVKWKLNPPAAPWWGGWIEIIVGLTKKLLRRLLGKRVVNYEEMVTILENCERVINARPLTYIAEDNDDLVPLTPEMFLREPRTEGEIVLKEFRCNFGKSYEKSKRLLKEFRKRFRSEYLGLLVHHDNRKKQRQLKVGDIVLVEVENRKQINWPMGNITKVFPGTDNVRRLVEVKTKSGFMKRAVQRLFPLEVPSEDVEQGDGELKPAEDEIVREKTPGVESVSVQEKTTTVK